MSDLHCKPRLLICSVFQHQKHKQFTFKFITDLNIYLWLTLSLTHAYTQTTRENRHYVLREHQILKFIRTLAQADQKRHFLFYDFLRSDRLFMRTGMAVIRLRICAGWAEPSLSEPEYKVPLTVTTYKKLHYKYCNSFRIVA